MTEFREDQNRPYIEMGSTELFRNKWFKLVQDNLITQSDHRINYTYVDHPGSVFVVPFTDNDEIILIKSYRHTIGSFCWEVPAGTMADRKGAPLAEVAAHELKEETGFVFSELIKLGTYFMSNGFAKAPGHFFAARGCRLSQKSSPEPGEFITQVTSLARDEVL